MSSTGTIAAVNWYLRVCPACGDEDVRPAGRRFSARCGCGGTYELYKLMRGRRLQTVPLTFGCALAAVDVLNDRSASQTPEVAA